MKKFLLLTQSIVFTAACSTAQTMKLPNGKLGYYVKCPRSIQNCYEKAAEVCPKGYEVQDKTNNSKILHYAGTLTTVKKFEMMVQCK